MIQVFMDTNIVSGLAKRDFPEQTVDAFFDVLDLSKSGQLQLWVSDLVLHELQEIPSDSRYYHDLIYRLLGNIRLKSTRVTDDLMNIQRGVWPLSVATSKHPLLKKLDAIIPPFANESRERARRHDISHLYQCIRNNIDVFWTEDRETVLSHAQELRELGVLALNTSELIQFAAVSDLATQSHD